MDGYLPVVIVAATLAILSCLALPVAGGQWLAPEGETPQFAPVPLYWLNVKQTPLVYRTVIDVPARCDRATAMLRTRGWAYVCVDGKQVYAWAPVEETKEEPGTPRKPATLARPGIPADPLRLHALDLTGHLTPGRHVLTVSAPAEGFVLDGALYAGLERLAPLASDEAWTVTAFRPTTIIEAQPIMTVAYAGRAVEGIAGAAQPVKVDGKWLVHEDDLAAAHFAGTLRRCRGDLDDVVWRANLLTTKGVYVADAAARGWAGPYRLDRRLLVEAATLGQQATAALALADELAGVAVSNIAQLKAVAPKLGELTSASAALSKRIDAATRGAEDADESKALDLAAKASKLVWPTNVKGPDQRRQWLTERIGHRLNRLNESRFDRLGWLPMAGLADSNVERWGVRINPVDGPSEVRAEPEWLFAIDPDKAGLAERWWRVGHRTDLRWRTVKLPFDWARAGDEAIARHRGAGWYRGRIRIPAAWAGQEVQLKLTVRNTERLWINGTEVTAHGVGQRKRTYILPAGVLACGAENILAARIEAGGPWCGILSEVTARCDIVAGPVGKNTPRVDVLATPLSPCAVLWPRTDTLQIHHAGRAALALPGEDRIVPAKGYDVTTDAKLSGNWAVLWLKPASPVDPVRPILLIFQGNPRSITCQKNVTRIKLRRPGEQVVAVRPWLGLGFADHARPMDLLGPIAIWSRVARAVPINYANVTRLASPGALSGNISVANIPAGPVLEQTVIYDYLKTDDEWGTTPVKIAPLPAACGMALDAERPGLKIEKHEWLQVFQENGPVGPYRALLGVDRIRYRYAIEPWPRRTGFTSWMFGNLDAGVPGNRREVELLAWVGADSYRPQHNWSNHPPTYTDKDGKVVRLVPESDTRTRVAILADACRDAGIGYVNNIDERLGGKVEQVVGNYDAFIETVCGHYESIARQLTGRPFGQVAYDLVNEPFHHKPGPYNAAMKRLTQRIRAIDKRHLIYIEPPQSWGDAANLPLVRPTGDPLTMYSFHDYTFKLTDAADRWPNETGDIGGLCKAWWPAIAFSLRNCVGLHCGEFGDFKTPTADSLAQKVLLNDCFRLFDQFGMHSHYYSGREVFQRLADGAVRPTNVARAYREYFERGDFSGYYAPPAKSVAD